MTYRRILLAICLLAGSAGIASAQIQHQLLSCVPARENAAVYATTEVKGEARLYYRMAGATEWCYVEATRILNSVRGILPKFEPDIEIEHFFVIVNEGEVTARSPQIYKVRTRNRCDTTAVARSVDFILNSCESEPGGLGSAVAAGYAIQGDPQLPDGSPSNPEQ